MSSTLSTKGIAGTRQGRTSLRWTAGGGRSHVVTGSPYVVASIIILLASLAEGQTFSTPTPLVARFQTGETLRYEVETSTSYSIAVARGYTTNMPQGPCQYSVSGVLVLAIGSASSDGNIPVDARYNKPALTSWHCTQVNQTAIEKELNRLAASAITFQVGPHGEVGFKHQAQDRFDYNSIVDVLTKVALDLLQTRLSDRPVAEAGVWKPHGQFSYWKDYLLGGLEVSGATMKWKSTPQIAGRDCAFVISKYVFSPTESSSGPITSGGSLRQQPINILSGLQQVSLLFDLGSRRIDWLHRSYHVENHVSVRPEEEPDPEVLMVQFEEDAKARLLPEKDSVAWLAAIKNFESAPKKTPLPAAAPDATAASLAELARRAVPNHKAGPAIHSLDFTPPGFVRWERQFCQAWYCSEVSVALPGEVKVVETGDQQTTYMVHTQGAVATVTVGPVLARKYQGLTADEELQKHSDYFLANQLWMTNQPGIGVKSEASCVDGYPARLTTFRGERRDLASVRGMLGILLSPWGESFPITCTFDQHSMAKLSEVCEHIIGLVKLRRPEPEDPEDNVDNNDR